MESHITTRVETLPSGRGCGLLAPFGAAQSDIHGEQGTSDLAMEKPDSRDLDLVIRLTLLLCHSDGENP